MTQYDELPVIELTDSSAEAYLGQVIQCLVELGDHETAQLLLQCRMSWFYVDGFRDKVSVALFL